jgi:carboxyl-terminal processing protease
MKKNNYNTIKFYSILTGLLVVGVFSGFYYFNINNDQIYLQINRSIDLFGKVYREISFNYVDEIDPDKFMEAGIEGMLSVLDPYTTYMNGRKNEDIDLIQTGKYAGVGITVGTRDDKIVITGLMDGYSAQKQGIMPGDVVLEIAGNSMVGKKSENVREFIRGEPGTEVKIVISREGEPNTMEFTLTREEIKLKNVTYSNIIHNDIGYIKLERFSRSAGEDVKYAIKELKERGNLSGLILDLRENPGGLLEAAYEIAKKFVPNKSLIVSTKGRTPISERKYVSNEEPIAGDIPMVALVNEQSASSSEVVVGSLQDLDRAVIVGNKTFGKGLVQTVTGLSNNTSLKITTAKYYTPSGRCIQKIDYMHKNNEGVFAIKPDSLKEHFKTLNGRDMLEAGGIYPDSIVLNDSVSGYVYELIRKSHIFKFSVQYVNANRKDENFVLSMPNVMKEFKKYLKDKKFEYKNDIEKKLNDISKLASLQNYSSEFMNQLKAMEKSVKNENEKEFERNEKLISQLLETEILGIWKGEPERIANRLKYDNQLKVATDILHNKKLYNKLLSIKN